MYDKTEKLGNSLIQHGKYNDRIYLMKLSEKDFPGIIKNLDSMAKEKKYGKIIAKVPAYAGELMRENGYILEASVPKLYNDWEDGLFLGKFFAAERKEMKDPEKIHSILAGCIAKTEPAQVNSPIDTPVNTPDAEFHYKSCGIEDVPQMVEVYKLVFKSYPFPIHDPDFLQESMRNNVKYFGIWHNDQAVALSSAQIDSPAQNAEMTDFATLPDYRERGFAAFLLSVMEEYIRGIGINTAYTIARSLSYGMNAAFARMGYSFGGTLVNNTNISGNFESMNIWYKSLVLDQD